MCTELINNLLCTLTLSDFDAYLDTPVPLVKKSHNQLLTWILNNPVLKFIIYKRTQYILNGTFKKLDRTLKEYKSNKIHLAKPEIFRDHIKDMIFQFSDLREELAGLAYYTAKQEKTLNTAASNIINRMMKLEVVAIKESTKNASKVDDTELVQLVMNNNSSELQKNIQTK